MHDTYHFFIPKPEAGILNPYLALHSDTETLKHSDTFSP